MKRANDEFNAQEYPPQTAALASPFRGGDYHLRITLSSRPQGPESYSGVFRPIDDEPISTAPDAGPSKK
jgi:hypothetical protein